jgi:transposase
MIAMAKSGRANLEGTIPKLWYRARTADGRSGTRKTMIVALARKLIIALWRFVTTGETLEGVVLRPAG